MPADAADRAASEVIGAVIVFSFLVVAFSVYQGVVIPEQNRDIEIQHNQAVQSSMQDLRNAIRQTATTGAEEAVSLTLGADYPQRTLAINPGVSAGSLRTAPLGDIVVSNVTATEPEVRDYVGPANPTLGPFETRAVVYQPVYTHYTEAPVTVYEHSLAANQFPGGVNLSITDQAVVHGRELSLVVLDGSLSAATQDTVTVDTEAISVSTTTVTVTNDSAGPIVITLPTRLSADDWRTLLDDEFDAPGTTDRHVTAVTQAGPGAVAIHLEPGVTYELRLAKVGVGSDATVEGPEYLTIVEGDEESVVEGGTTRLVVETRDRFNNPTSSVSVSASVVGGPGNLSDSPVVTGADGRATFVYEAPDDVDDDTPVTVNATFGGGTPANRSVTFDLVVLDADGGAGGTDDINPGESGEVILDDAVEGTVNWVADLTFNNTAGTSRTVDAVRISFYYPDSTGSEALRATIAGTTFPVGGTLADGDAVSFVMSPGLNTVSVSFEPTSGSRGVKTRGDFFIMTIRYEGTAGTDTYFVAVR